MLIHKISLRRLEATDTPFHNPKPGIQLTQVVNQRLSRSPPAACVQSTAGR
jgi:hypothetical protein